MNREPADCPVSRYKADLLALFVSAQDLLTEDGYAAVLPHLDALRLALPDQVPLPRRPRLEVVPDAVHPLDVEVPR